MEEIKGVLKAKDVGRCVATILAIGTANPLSCVNQDEFLHSYFKLTNNHNNTSFKELFTRICNNSMIKNRYMHLTEDILKKNPNLCDYAAQSLNTRQDIKIKEIPKLAERAAMVAIKEWGKPISNITHIIFHSSTGAADMPGADYKLVKSLGLNRSIKRIMLYNLGCFAGGTVLRIAKDLVENNHGASVLAVCAEITSMDATFGRLSKDDKGRLVGHAIFGDGAAALVIGNADDHENKGLFQIVSTSQTILADSEGCIEGHIREDGVTFTLSPRVPKLIGDNIEMCLVEAFTPFKISDWNSLFWVAHPGGAAILREVESRVGLEQEKLRASWHVLREYGNMSSASVFFILDEMRNKSLEEGRKTTGEGKNWGVLFGFGPGLTVETVVLHSIPI
ncbi:hypothetical protein CsatA_018781 [Cannabis sativa]